MNALTKAKTTALAGGDNYNPFAQAGAGAGSSTYMKFVGATGDFTYGQDDEEMPHGTRLAAAIEESQWVWSFWWDGEVLETIETLVAEDPHGWDREPDDLPEKYDGDMSMDEIRAERADRSNNFMDGWSVQAVLNLRQIGGEGEEFTLKLNGGVGVSAFRALLQTFGRQYKFKMGLVPVIELEARSYKSKHKNVGKRWSPILKIVEWKSEEELMEASGEDAGMYDEPDRDEAPARNEKSEGRKTAALPPPEEEEGAAAGDEAPAAPQGRAARGRRGTNYG